MLLQSGNRAKAYLQKLVRYELLPNFVILLKSVDEKQETLNLNPEQMKTAYYNPREEEEETMHKAGINFALISASSCNEKQVVETLAERPEEYIVFAGRDILKEAFLANKKFIHIHPGKLPQYRGSTCPYYSTIIERKWCCTAMIMQQEIDCGEIITVKEFPLPSSGIDATRIYDPHTRSETLADV
ncbi:MAG: formyltransferase family protein, partial [Candidatus Paceibacterota bacterium]